MNRPVSRQVNIDELGNLPIGTPLQLEPLDAKVKGLRLKSALIGLEHQEYMILKMPRIILGGDNKPQNNNADPVLADGDKVVIKYMFNGTIYAFESNVMSIIDDPVKQLYICYPETLREQNLRQSIRLECHLPGSLTVWGKHFEGIIVDLSETGCRYRVKMTPEVQNKMQLYEVDQPVGVTFQLPGVIGMFVLTGKLRNLTKDAIAMQAGIAFNELEYESRKRLQEYLYKFVEED